VHEHTLDMIAEKNYKCANIKHFAMSANEMQAGSNLQIKIEWHIHGLYLDSRCRCHQSLYGCHGYIWKNILILIYFILFGFVLYLFFVRLLSEYKIIFFSISAYLYFSLYHQSIQIYVHSTYIFYLFIGILSSSE